MGHVMACDRITGELLWTLDMQKEFETEVPHWYSGQCPRIENGQLILAPAGGEVLMVGIDYTTGEIAWKTPNTVGYRMSHSSIMPMTIQGKRMFVYAGIGGLVGVSAESTDIGKLLWNVDWRPSVIAPSPLQLASDKVLMVAGYGSGGIVVQVNNNDGRWSASIIDRYRPSEGLSSEQQTPILHGQMVITVPPNDGGGIRGRLVAYSPSNLRTPIWQSAADERFGLGPYMIIGNYVFAFRDDGELFVYELLPRGMRLVKRQRILSGHDGWGPMAYADGYLVLKDADWVYCLKIRSYE
jgi:outer membrane protein assembly factor BamB